MKFVLFVEGKTEKMVLRDFIKRWLDPRLREPVGVKIVRFNGWQEYEKDIRKKVSLNLSGKAGADVIAAIGLLDLYGPTFYPAGTSTVTQRYDWAKRELERSVGHSRFRQHFAVHEVEAWLLADPTIFPPQVGQTLPGNCDQPEQVNFLEPPAQLLKRLYKAKLNTAYKKVTDGANLFLALDPAIAYGKCPYLQKLLDDMLMFATS